MNPIRRLRRFIDRQWIKQHWCGSQSLTLRAVACAPLLLAAAISSLLDSYTAQMWVGVLAFMTTMILTFWIEFRRMVGTGSFSSIRSERFVRRQRAREARQRPN